MKLLIASDIHGSDYYLDKLIQRIEIEKPDKIVLLGDFLYHGPRNDLPKDYNPKEMIGKLNAYKDKIIGVRGNCDSEVDQMVLDFPMMADYVELQDNNQVYLFTHGHLFDSNKLPVFNEGLRVVSGHTHIPINEVKEGVTYLNPGSVSIPKGGSTHSYLIIDNNEIIFKDIEGHPYKI